jgi:MFS family permease
MPFFAFLLANTPFLAAGFLLSLLSTFGQTVFISVFAGEIRDLFGLSHGAWGAYYALGTLASAVVMLWAGVLTDLFRVRVLGAVVMVGLAVACLGMVLNPYVVLLPAVIFLLRFFGQGMMSHISGVAMARWFVASRGRALAIAALGFSAGEVVLPLTFVALKRHVDWHLLWALAAAVLILALPLLSALLRLERTPQSMAEENQSLGMDGRHWTRAEALCHPLFWMLMPMLICGPTFVTAFFFQQVHLAGVKGWEHLSLVALFPIYTIAGVLAMLVTGWAVDRFGTARMMPFYPIALALFFLAFSQVDSLGFAAPIMVLMGLSSGAQATVPVAFWAEFYGTRHIGAIRAVAGSIMVLGSAIGPIVTGWLIDLGLDFPAQMVGIAVFIIAACGIAALGVAPARRRLAAAPQIDVIGT